MVASLIRCLMLLTMLLHSVFGCTWHHFHTCQTYAPSAGSVVQQQSTPAESHSCACHQHQHHVPAASTSEVPAHDCGGNHPDSVPCGHSSGCDHSMCSFIASGLLSELSQDELSHGELHVCIASELAHAAICRLSHRELMMSELHSENEGAPEFCARHQVWQI